MWAEVNRPKQEILPPQTLPQYDCPPQRSSARPPPHQPCSVSRVAIVKGTVEPERSDQNKRGKISLDVNICEGGNIEGKMEPKDTTRIIIGWYGS